jgi:hypothetical protein
MVWQNPILQLEVAECKTSWKSAPVGWYVGGCKVLDFGELSTGRGNCAGRVGAGGWVGIKAVEKYAAITCKINKHQQYGDPPSRFAAHQPLKGSQWLLHCSCACGGEGRWWSVKVRWNGGMRAVKKKPVRSCVESSCLCLLRYHVVTARTGVM